MAANNFGYAKPVYSPYGGSKESIVIEDEGKAALTGSINGDCRDRSSSLISIVSVHHEDVVGYDDGDSDREATAIEDNKPVTKDDVIMNLSLRSPSLRELRWFLQITFLWFPQNASFARKTFYTAMQVLIVGFLCCCYAFDMGAFHNRSLIEDELSETVTAAKDIIWSFRYLEMYIVGVFYFRKRHLEKMLSEVILTRRYWKKVRRTILKVSIAVLLFVFVVPVISKIVQMNLTTRKVESFSLKEILWNVFHSVMARIVALPIFLAFVYVVYITFSQIRLFKEQLQKWPGGMKEEARNRFIDIKTIIRDAERSFQTFLITHLLLLLVLLIPAIFSCVERLQTEGHYDETYSDQTQLASAPNNLPGNAENFIAVNGTYYQGKLFKLPANYGQNKTQSQAPRKHTVSKPDVAGIAKIVCANLGDFVEMLVLYSLPLFFLAKLHKIMCSLPEVVQDLKFSEQKKNRYLFQNKQILDEMKGDLSTGRGIQILRMNLTGIKAALLTLLMPFLTTAIHLLFLHVDLS